MVTDEEIKKYFKEYYEKKNIKRARSINIPERLFKDFHKLCIDKGISMSEELRYFMTNKIMENKNIN